MGDALPSSRGANSNMSAKAVTKSDLEGQTTCLETEVALGGAARAACVHSAIARASNVCCSSWCRRRGILPIPKAKFTSSLTLWRCQTLRTSAASRNGEKIFSAASWTRATKRCKLTACAQFTQARVRAQCVCKWSARVSCVANCLRPARTCSHSSCIACGVMTVPRAGTRQAAVAHQALDTAGKADLLAARRQRLRYYLHHWWRR